MSQSQLQSQRDRKRTEPLLKAQEAILEVSNTPTEWSSTLIKTRITEAIRRLQKNPDFENPDYAGAMLIREVVAAFDDLPEIQAYVVRVFTARGVMPGLAHDVFTSTDFVV